MIRKAAAAAVVGVHHQMVGIPCQDYAVAAHRGPISIAIVSDGAGSCARSGEASKAVAEWASAYVPIHFEMLFEMTKERTAALHLVRRSAFYLRQAGLVPEESYCTLLFVAVHEDGRWICGHVGDGAIIRRDAEGDRIMSYPENGEYRYETFFINELESRAAQHLRMSCGELRSETSFLLTSDGCEDLLCQWDTSQPAPAATAMCQWLGEYDEDIVEKALQRDLAERFSQRSEDDLSIALLWCK